MKWFLAMLSGAALCFSGCASPPRMPVASYVQQIEMDEVNAHLLRGEWIVLEGTLAEKDVDTSNKLLLDGQSGSSNLSGVRKAPVRAPTAFVVETRGDVTYVVFCEFSSFGADRLNRTSLGSRVAVRGILDSWKRSEHELVPQLHTCSLQ